MRKYEYKYSAFGQMRNQTEKKIKTGKTKVPYKTIIAMSEQK